MSAWKYEVFSAVLQKKVPCRVSATSTSHRRPNYCVSVLDTLRMRNSFAKPHILCDYWRSFGTLFEFGSKIKEKSFLIQLGPMVKKIDRSASYPLRKASFSLRLKSIIWWITSKGVEYIQPCTAPFFSGPFSQRTLLKRNWSIISCCDLATLSSEKCNGVWMSM